MSIASVTLATRQQSAQPCACGCADCSSVGCSLDCLERPRFFCGQLLTDRDLTALIGWTQAKLRLSRFRAGWGVVCGLELRRAPGTPASVLLGPGYAVSSCGDDIVVCADSSPLDLSKACTSADERCADPQTWREPAADDETLSLGGISVRTSELRVIDLFLAYAEEDTEPQTALGRSACGEAGLCEHSRTREVYHLEWRYAEDAEAQRLPLTSWEEGYRRVFSGNAIDGLRTRAALTDALKAEPAHQFGFLEALIAQIPEGEEGREAALARAIFWLLQDRRNAYLQAACLAAAEGAGVPLARAWLRASEEGDKTSCRLLAIDSGAPYRRAFGPQGWPVAAGQINLARFIWQRPEVACLSFGDLGLQVREETAALPETVEALKNAVDGQVIAAGCGEPLIALVYDAEGLGKRIVGFRREPVTDLPSEARPARRSR
jgi:hypothetical protein